MATKFYSCDEVRRELIESLKYLDSPCDAVSAMLNYFTRVDDQTSTNNYCDLIKACSYNCQRMSNPRLMAPLNPLMNLEKLLVEFGYDWPKRGFEQLNNVKGILNEIEDEFAAKGLKSSSIAGVDRYKPTGPPPNSRRQHHNQSESNNSIQTADEEHNPILDDERLKNIDKKIAERILNEVVDHKQDTKWDDIAGLENVKQAINEIVVYPMQNPELFQGLLAPAKGLLLFGPPGTGKTLIGKCIASESGATFFAISASSLTSKWIGEGEKMVRALFAVARIMQPSVVFIDEIDSLLTQRVDGEHDSSRRMKTEFLVQFDGVSTLAEDRLLIVGATNRPQELDEAARRRFTKRLYIPLPDELARKQIIKTLMSKGKSNLTDECIEFIVEKTDGFSGADMATLCKEAALGSVRALIRARGSARNLGNEDIPPISRSDFESALKNVKASVGDSDLDTYEQWDSKYGATRDSACSTQSI